MISITDILHDETSRSLAMLYTWRESFLVLPLLYRFEEDGKDAMDDWLGLGSASQKKRPLGLASTMNAGGGDDWLDMAKPTETRPKTAPEKVVAEKPPRTPDKRPATSGANKKSNADDDWLASLTAKVDSDDELSLPGGGKKTLSRQSSVDRQLSRQSSLDSMGSGRVGKPAVSKPAATSDDWLGLGDEKPSAMPKRKGLCFMACAGLVGIMTVCVCSVCSVCSVCGCGFVSHAANS